METFGNSCGSRPFRWRERFLCNANSHKQSAPCCWLSYFLITWRRCLGIDLAALNQSPCRLHTLDKYVALWSFRWRHHQTSSARKISPWSFGVELNPDGLQPSVSPSHFLPMCHHVFLRHAWRFDTLMEQQAARETSRISPLTTFRRPSLHCVSLTLL